MPKCNIGEQGTNIRRDDKLTLPVRKVHMIVKKKLLSILIVLVITNLLTTVFLIRTWWANHLWEEEMYGVAGYAATIQALNDYKAGTCRLYELAEDGEHKFTGRHDGSFEIWYRPYYSSLGKPGQYTQQVFVDAYNSKMWYMYEHPETFKAHLDDSFVEK